MKEKREYPISIDTRILELLGPNLYTNIYYILAELIANAYDAAARNVYIFCDSDTIIVEDDGMGMSYKDGDIRKYLNVAAETRTTSEESYTVGFQGVEKRKKMGRKGVGKLAALSVSENVKVMSVKEGEKSGFILSRHIKEDRKLEPIDEDEIVFKKITDHGTAIVMMKPQYKLHKTLAAIKNNLLKIFPIVNSDFRIHLKTVGGEITIDDFNKEIMSQLCSLITLGEDFEDLVEHFKDPYPDKDNSLLRMDKTFSKLLKLKDRKGCEKPYELKINGWIGAYRTTRGRKMDVDDFPDNFISLFANGKLGEYNILPIVQKNRLSEVYVVGQLHVDLFEETELPDMALSNRQGYKTDDLRYQEVIDFVREHLLHDVIELRGLYASYVKDQKEEAKRIQQRNEEKELRKQVDIFASKTSRNATNKIFENVLEEGNKSAEDVCRIIKHELNEFLPIVGVKKKVDANKKKILISHTKADKPLADVVYKMLTFNNVPSEDIIYTNSDDEECWIPDSNNVFEYLKEFFVDSISTKKIYVIYITSNEMASSWGAVTEVGAGWITKSDHKIFNIVGHTPQKPLDVDPEWHNSVKTKENNIVMGSPDYKKFIKRIATICSNLGYPAKSSDENNKELVRYVLVK